MPTDDLKADGAAGGRRAAALLSIAVCAEMSHTSMDEDGAKVDLKMSIRHAHRPGTLLAFHCQVKSGHSFRAASSTAELITLSNIDASTLSALSEGVRPALLLWVPPKPSSRIYWHILQARRKEKTPIRIPRANYISPVLRYDLSKASSFLHAKGTFPRRDVAHLSDVAIPGRAREAYNELRTKDWHHPLAGPFEVTQFAWRHVTRQSRPTARRLLSLRAVPYLGRFFEEMPTRYIIANHTVRRTGQSTLVCRDVICWYREALRIEDVPHTLLLRIREDITYPSKWWSSPLGIGSVTHTAKLVSWWCKA